MLTTGEDKATDRLSSLALTSRQKFMDGMRMTIRDSDVVHAVDRERWVAGELVPQPLCHTAVYGWSPAALKATRAPVSCQRCRRKIAAPDELLLPMGTFQPSLFSIKGLHSAA